MSIVKLNNRAVKDITAFGSISSLGSLTHIATQTASSSATVSFTSGIDSTYKEYIFYFVNIHPATDNVYFSFQGNKAGGSGYNETITSSTFQAYHEENGGSAVLGYRTDLDQAQGTSFQQITQNVGNANDESISGYLHLFNPSSTTFTKNFIARLNTYYYGDITIDNFSAGYFNETDAIEEIQFKLSSGNIDSGQILLFGLS
tara:strand:- start:625 stop:1230 length:606 start_codon:yes stop_codon:yes gene_type:complete